MRTVTKTRWEYHNDENGRCRAVEVPYEKYIFDDDDKMRIVSEYYQSHEPAQNVVERYNLSSKQVLFNWMDKYLHEESSYTAKLSKIYHTYKFFTIIFKKYQV